MYEGIRADQPINLKQRNSRSPSIFPQNLIIDQELIETYENAIYALFDFFIFTKLTALNFWLCKVRKKGRAGIQRIIPLVRSVRIGF